MLFMAGYAPLCRDPEVVSRLCIERLLDIAVACEAFSTGDDFRRLMALCAIVQTTQVLVSGRQLTWRELGLCSLQSEQTQQRHTQVYAHIHREKILGNESLQSSPHPGKAENAIDVP
jgi:hypothetical protein